MTRNNNSNNVDSNSNISAKDSDIVIQNGPGVICDAREK